MGKLCRENKIDHNGFKYIELTKKRGAIRFEEVQEELMNDEAGEIFVMIIGIPDEYPEFIPEAAKRGGDVWSIYNVSRLKDMNLFDAYEKPTMLVNRLIGNIDLDSQENYTKQEVMKILEGLKQSFYQRP